MNKQLMQAIEQQEWAILPAALEAMMAAARAGVPLQAARVREQSRAGAVAVVPVYGTLTQRGGGGLFEMYFGGTTTEGLTAAVRQLVGDETIKAIVLDIDSPGGTVGGMQEAADELFKMRGAKPIIAVADPLAASAAYWIASSANEIVVSPSSQVGSIGVFAVHEDISKMAEDIGIKVTLISAGKYKTEGNEFEPLTDEAREAIQKRVNEYYGAFVAGVARGRGVTPAAVRGGFGEGRVVGAKEAVAEGMADRIGTLRDTLAKLGAGAATGMRAEADDAPIMAQDAEADRARLRFEIARGA